MPLELSAFIFLLFLGVLFLGSYMKKVFEEGSNLNIPLLTFLERRIYSLCGIETNEEMTSKTYLKALLLFNFIGFLFLFFLQLLQGFFPLNPENFRGVEVGLAFNTAISFVTNTNWQSYGGETTLSYFTQMGGLTVQNFLSAATGNAVLLALIRGISRKTSPTIGNFWVDLTKTIVYLLLPLCVFFSLFLVNEGVIQNLKGYVQATTLSSELQTIPMGPVASQVAIKQLGSNGGGFFNANGAHPFENPTPLSNFLETLAIVLIPAAATYMYGLLVQSKKQGLVLFFVMFTLWLGGVGIALYSENIPNVFLGENPVLEGKETRFGAGKTLLWAVSTTATSNGSVNGMQSSLSPLVEGISLFNMMIGEVIFGGVGVGLSGMLMFVFLTVFLAGLMVGRTPEYLGKKIEKKEIQWVMVALLTPCALILLSSGMGTLLPQVLENLSSGPFEGPHDFSEILYTFSSTAANNGSAFSGIQSNTLFLNVVLGVIMLVGRLAIILPSLAIAGSLAKKNRGMVSLGTFPTDSVLFAVLLSFVILIIGALTFLPALTLGPFIEHLLMLRGG